MLTETEMLSPLPAPTRKADWLDLALYLLVGFGGFILFGLVTGPYLPPNNILSSAALYLANLAFFGGLALLVGRLRSRRLSGTDMGLFTANLPWKWIAIGAGIALLTLPLRIGIGLLVTLLSGMDLEALNDTARTQILAPEGSLLVNFLVSLVLGGVLVPISEELFFRGALFGWLRQRMGMWPSVLISSVAFALGHFDLSAVVATSFVIGVINALLYEKTRSIWVPAVVHIVNNSIAIVLLYGLMALQQFLPIGTF